MATVARENQTFTLPDGRVLGFAEYGDPDGTPLLYFHGFPSSRIEASAVLEVANRRGLRCIALDRPGFGLSSPQPRRRILDWPADVRDFARGMNLPRFAVLGLSGGGPFALACARALPPEMLSGVGLFASGPPWFAGAHHMSLYRRLLSSAATYCPGALRIATDALVSTARWLATTGPVVRRIDGWLLGLRQAADQVAQLAVAESGGAAKDARPNTTPKRTIPEVRSELLRVLLDEPFAQGAAAAVDEAKLLSSQDWGFKLEDVDYATVRLWHGARDTNAPAVMIRYMADKLPHAVLREFEGDTHYTMFKHLEGALAELVPQEAPKLATKGV
ncbi:Alpha/Beta hydrolase protein [Ilyonectria robusta]|uniref:Alpha/Beta hydrolase protein n=1 Tax=Ilyonectria robusta TaxID=1079257 RepID=UPI001E8ED425|nr:Alpha/Beta hydrolase protein [Ilyonectria robusta]KAH8685326.1 Alpha/Beta hydrolase protein [Ilyonectria robusta]